MERERDDGGGSDGSRERGGGSAGSRPITTAVS